MNREQVIELARQAGLIRVDREPRHASMVHLERFATLVAAAEREACAKVCDAFVDIKEAARSRKRVEESIGGCLDEEINAMRHELTVSTYNAGIKSCAAAIRARNTNKETK